MNETPGKKDRGRTVVEPERPRGTYRVELEKLFASQIPRGARILELGCGSGRLLAALKPRYGLGVDSNPEAVASAKRIHAGCSELEFVRGDPGAPEVRAGETFDYIILSDRICLLRDVRETFLRLHGLCETSTRVVVSFPSNLWRPFVKLTGLLGLPVSDMQFNWLSWNDVRNLLYLADFEIVSGGGRILLPVGIPGLSWVMNRVLAKLPFISTLCLTWYVVARPRPARSGDQNRQSVSIVIPTRNEKGNIEAAFQRTPSMGSWTELIFVDGHSQDGTVEEIERCRRLYGAKWRRVLLLPQTGRGKGQAVRQGFSECQGDILMILDSDLTVPPESLPQFYGALVSGHGEFINGSRLVYAMERNAMRFLNMAANHVFAVSFTWLLGQPIKDTLCGTKALWRHDYETIAAQRSYFGDFDPFGDFDLLFGAARLNRRIVDLPVRYAERTYGEIKIKRWRHGLLLLRMSLIAFRKFKLS